MAIIKYGPLASEVRGSIGGTVFSRARAGAYVKQLTKPVHADTTRRNLWASRMALIYGHWRDILDNDERIAWNTLGENTDWENALGDEYHPTGFNLFLRSSALLLHVDRPIVDLAPDTATGTHSAVSYQMSDPFTLQANILVPPDVVHGVAFWISPRLPFTRYFHRSPWPASTWKSTFELDAGWVTIFSTPYTLPPCRLFVRDRGVYATAEITAPYYASIDNA